MRELQSPLGKFADVGREPLTENAKKACRQAWHETGTICLRPEWFQSWADRQQAIILVERLFGKRGNPQ